MPAVWPGLSSSLRIEAVDRAHQALAPQDLVAAGDAAGEVVVDVEDRRQLQSVTKASSASSSSGMAPRPTAGVDLLQQLDRRLRPHAPMAEQAALEAQRHLAVAGADHHRRDEVGDDVIVVAGVERDAILGAGLGDAEGDVERAVAVERRHLDRHDIVDGRQSASRRRATAGCRRPPSAGRSRPAASRAATAAQCSISSSSLAPLQRASHSSTA